MKDSIRNLIEDGKPHVLKSLGILMLDREWSTDQIEKDLGSQAIESLLDEVEHMDYSKLEGIYDFIKSQEV
jgi:hypothetical protein